MEDRDIRERLRKIEFWRSGALSHLGNAKGAIVRSRYDVAQDLINRAKADIETATVLQNQLIEDLTNAEQ